MIVHMVTDGLLLSWRIQMSEWLRLFGIIWYQVHLTYTGIGQMV